LACVTRKVGLGLCAGVLLTLNPSIQAAGIDLNGLVRPSFRIYTDDDGLPMNVIESIAIDRKGYLWVGTQNGAAYYNGRHWSVVKMPSRSTSSLVFAILASLDGSLWFGTERAGLAHLKEGRWETFDTSNSGLPHNEVRSLLETLDASGKPQLWIGTGGGGVACLASGRWTVYNKDNTALRNNNVRSLAITTSAAGVLTLWVGSMGGGLSRFENGRWATFDDTNSGLPSNAVRCLAADSRPAEHAILWIGTADAGVVHYEDGRWSSYTSGNSALPSNAVRSLAETRTSTGDRILWAGTNADGLARFESGRWSTFKAANSQLPKDAILSLQVEPGTPGAQGLWIGTLDGGLAHYVPGGWQTLNTRNSGLPDNQVWSVLESEAAPEESTYWFGTTGGLARYEASRWSVFNSQNSGLPVNMVLSLLETRSPAGSRGLWVGTNGGGLVRFEQGKWTTLNSSNSGLPGNVVESLLESRSTTGESILWVGTEKWDGTEKGGLARYAGGRWTTFSSSNSDLPGNKVLSLLETVSPSGGTVLWVGTDGGLASFESGRWTSYTTANSALPNSEVRGLRETIDAAGRHHLWVGTTGGGIVRLNPAAPGAEKWLALSEESTPALPDNTVWQIRQDAGGKIYLYTEKGIAQLTPRKPDAENLAEYEIYTFTTAHGLPSKGCNQGASWLDRRGRLWVGTGAGAAFFEEILDQMPKPLVIERTLLDGRDRILPAKASLSYNENNFQFEYALLSFFREADTCYRFQLEGFDPRLSAWTTEPRKEYTNLGEGDYVFKVWAKDYAGNVAGPEIRSFHIQSAPWLTWWAYSIYTLALGGCVLATARVQQQRLIRKERGKAQLREAELRAETAEAQAKAVESENRRKSDELNFARQLQLSMLPKNNIILDQVDIVGKMRTATEVGGDYYDFIKIDDDRYCVAIGDATGHGVGAGLVVGMVKTALFNSVLLLKKDSTVADLMVDLNTTLKASLTHRGVGMCCAVALINTRNLTAEISSTGMPFPYFYESRSGKVQILEMPGPPLGFMKKIKVRSHTLSLAPGDRLVFLSDGFHERMDVGGECWGYETVTREVTQTCRAESGAEAIADRLIAACDGFGRGRETDDDMTVIVVNAKGPQEHTADVSGVS
jgi:serine phosphatase RsbU (regulator of sigma subunit)/ligand-binding sensor domain-containing protein